MSRDIVANLKFRRESNSGGFTAEKLARAIEQGYLAEKRDDKFTTKKTFAPSSIGGYQGTCARYWYQAFNGADFIEKSDAIGLANMATGSHAHDRIQKALEKSGVLVEAEKELNLEDPPMRGYIDAIVKIDGETVVGEIKTCRPEAFVFRQTTMKPMAQHLYQILIYMHYMKLDKGFLFYENKGDQSFLTIPVEMNERNRKILDDCFDWLRKVRANWELGEGTDSHIPKQPWTKRNKICRSCPLFERCWPEDGVAPQSGVVIPPMEVVKP